MEKIVYILGAGFSAPFGLPVMRDFLIRAKDLYFQDTKKYAHFKKVLATIDGMHKAKTYFDVDLLNIEEILSILDMEDHVGAQTRTKDFCRLIEDVISAYTPPPPKPFIDQIDGRKVYREIRNLSGNDFFSNDSLWQSFGGFVGNLMNLCLYFEPFSSGYGQQYNLYFSPEVSPTTSYSVITLNYDLLFENVLKTISEHAEPLSPEIATAQLLRISKLHGSVGGEIVAPTWKKWAGKSLRNAWRQAYDDLCSATQIRILGYSLPVSDSYVRYLLEAAILKSQHLKNIDVVCLDDPHGTMEHRYRSFINFKFMRFQNRNLKDYIILDGPYRHYWSMHHKSGNNPNDFTFVYNQLESAHRDFMAHS